MSVFQVNISLGIFFVGDLNAFFGSPILLLVISV